MSFQGDVRGIGLAELLQGLARGRKEGVLALTGDLGARAFIGLREGKAHLLPHDSEDAERWRDRGRDAWAHHESQRADSMRMADIAHAERMEIVYQLLDGGAVHFRFEPIDIDPAAMGEPGGPTEKGLPIEFLLLEYARIADELAGAQHASSLPRDVVPLLMDPALIGDLGPKTLAQIDGRSTLQELADRLACPIRVIRLAIAPALFSGGMRLAQGSELLSLALDELRAKNFSRAAHRLTSWARDAEPGPMRADWAEALSNEWVAGRLPAALRTMAPRRVRTVLKRLDHTLRNPSVSVVHWNEAVRLHRDDQLANLRRMAMEFREDERGDRPEVRDLLDVARIMRDNGRPRRMQPALAIAAAKGPDGLSQQLELGLGLIEAGRPEDGAAWVHAAARDMINRGQSDRAVAPLRQLLEALPRDRESRALLSRARRTSTAVRKLRKQLTITGAIGLVAASVALVVAHKNASYRSRLDEVRGEMHDPQRALLTLRRLFPSDPPPAVLALQKEIDERQRAEDLQAKTAWLDRHQSAHQLATQGDPLEALAAIRALDDPPNLVVLKHTWPRVGDLYIAVGERMIERVRELPTPEPQAPDQELRETELELLGRTIRESLSPAERPTDFGRALLDSVARVERLIEERRSTRGTLIANVLRSKNLEELSSLLEEARIAKSQYAFDRSQRLYEQIFQKAPSPQIRDLIGSEYKEVLDERARYGRARDLAESGKHQEAIALLSETFKDPSKFLLPWKVATFPAGATVTTGEGRTYTTPFAIETTIGQRVVVEITLDGFRPAQREFTRPSDHFVWLDRTPEREWHQGSRVDAIPVPYLGDHVLVDRDGNVARVGSRGAAWSRSVQTLSGVARAPVFLPSQEGRLLMLTEDGRVWILSAETGKSEGPWELGSPPTYGPLPLTNMVVAHLANGQSAIWRESLKPELQATATVRQLSDAGEDYRFGPDCGMQVIRRRANPTGTVDSRFSDWSVEILSEVLRVHPKALADGGFSITRSGDWEFIAWEPASPDCPSGRFWLSDGAGVRAYLLDAE